MNLSGAKVLAGYLITSTAALAGSVKLACALNGQTLIAFSGSFFR